jgi:hypothetical protein
MSDSYHFGERLHDKYPVPDLLVSKRGHRSVYAEVKFKSTTMSVHRGTGRLDTVVDTNDWNNYNEVKLITGADVHILIANGAENEIRGGELAELAITVRHEPRFPGKGGGTFVIWDAMRHIATISDVRKQVAQKCFTGTNPLFDPRTPNSFDVALAAKYQEIAALLKTNAPRALIEYVVNTLRRMKRKPPTET